MNRLRYVWNTRNDADMRFGWVGVIRYFWNLLWWYVYPCPRDCPSRNGYFSDKCETCNWAHKR